MSSSPVRRTTRARAVIVSTRSTERTLSLGWLLRAAGLIVLLVGEVVGLTIRFDVEPLLSRTDWWARGLVWSPMLLAGLLAFTAAFLLVVSPRLTAIARSLAAASEAHGWAPWLGLQLVAVGLFAWCTARLFEGGGTTGGAVVGWVLTAVAAAALWLLALAPAGFWWALARRERVAVLVAAVASGAAVAIGRVARAAWVPLATLTFWLVERLLGVLYAHVVSVPSEQSLGTPAFQVEIAPECSGYEGIALILVFLAVYLWLFRHDLRFPQAFLLLPVGVLAIWSANVVRITLLIAIGTSVSAGVALGGFHSQAGWLFFLAVSLGLMMASHRVRLFVPRAATVPAAPSPRREATEAAALLVPVLVLLASLICTSMVSSGFDRWYPLRVIATAGALWYFRATYQRLDWRWTWQSAAIGGAVFLLWLALEPPVDASGTALEVGLGELSRGAAGLWLGFRIIGSTLTVPVAEELAFRGYLIRKLVSPAFENVEPGRFTWLSFVVSSVAFGLLHGRWLAGTLAGMAYAAALYRRGRVGEAVYAHMTTNGLIAAYVLWSGRWSLWS